MQGPLRCGEGDMAMTPGAGLMACTEAVRQDEWVGGQQVVIAALVGGAVLSVCVIAWLCSAVDRSQLPIW